MERKKDSNVGNYVLYVFKFPPMLFLLHADICVYAFSALKITKQGNRGAQYAEEIFDLLSSINESPSFDFI